MRRLRSLGLGIAIVTNQADVGRGLRDDDPVVRRRACEAAARLVDVDVEVDVDLDVVAALDDADASVVEAAAWALGERGRPDARVVAALSRNAVGHDDALCREAAVAALGAVGDVAGLPAILAATRDKPAVRRRAVIALAPFTGAEVDAALRRALGDHDRQVREAAEDLLGDCS